MNIGITCAIFHAVRNVAVASDKLNMSVNGADITDDNNFRRRREILSKELVAGDLRALMTSLTSRSVNGENLKVVAAFSGIFSSLIGSGAEGLNQLAMSLTDDTKNELIILPEAFDMDGDKQGHSVVVRRFLPKPVHSDIVLKNLRLFVARYKRNERLAMRTACVQ